MTLTIHPWTADDAKRKPIPELPEGSQVIVAGLFGNFSLWSPQDVIPDNWLHKPSMARIIAYILPARPAKPPVPKPGDVIPEGTLLFDGRPMAVVGVGRSSYPIKMECRWDNGDLQGRALNADEWDANVTYATPPEPVKGEVVLTGAKDRCGEWHIPSRVPGYDDTHRVTLPLDANGDLPEGEFVPVKIERIVK